MISKDFHYSILKARRPTSHGIRDLVCTYIYIYIYTHTHIQLNTYKLAKHFNAERPASRLSRREGDRESIEVRESARVVSGDVQKQGDGAAFFWLLSLAVLVLPPYTPSPLEDSRLFGPSPWKILRHYLWTNGLLSNPAPGEDLLSGNLVMETGCKLPSSNADLCRLPGWLETRLAQITLKYLNISLSCLTSQCNSGWVVVLAGWGGAEPRFTPSVHPFDMIWLNIV